MTLRVRYYVGSGALVSNNSHFFPLGVGGYWGNNLPTPWGKSEAVVSSYSKMCLIRLGPIANMTVEKKIEGEQRQNSIVRPRDTVEKVPRPFFQRSSLGDLFLGAHVDLNTCPRCLRQQSRVSKAQESHQTSCQLVCATQLVYHSREKERECF